MSTIQKNESTTPQGPMSDPRQSRRKFLGYAGAAGLIATGLASCQKFGDYFPKHNGGNSKPVDLGSGDVGILNYAYALEQLEAAFYTRVCDDFYGGASTMERKYLKDIRDHEIAHREFFKNALGSAAIRSLDVDFSTINFKKRDSVLQTAKAFEDLGVSAYNGAGALIKDAGYLTLAGKIVSVEARHAAYIRDLLSYGDFAGSDILNGDSLDTSRLPGEVLPIAGVYIKNKIDASHLPS